ncbi:slit homolog 2 protein-like [Mytilus californianus]|uniref:slit homolog 2 protein-like n=1 Tax=Mytilus californianus TaxID=6549 RepID=UPI002247E86E|nr:slit homolog 2 protein-like [Mytilus californianus]
MMNSIGLNLIILNLVNVVDLLNNDDIFKVMFNRTDLLCPVFCNGYRLVSCCMCNVQKTREKLQTLNVVHNAKTEYPTIEKPNVLNIQYQIIHIFKKTKRLPVNICNFTGLVEINFSNNEIKSIDISCVKSLDVLIMRRNRIEYLRNDTFFGMKFLRMIDLSYNNLRHIEPGILIHTAGSLLNFDVSNNFLTTVDVTNFLWEKQPAFCKTDFSFNEISSISNELHWTCKRNTQFGYGGMIIFSNNNFSHFANFSEIGFKNFFLLGKLLDYGFDFRENNWICDCRIYFFAFKASLVLDKQHRDYFELSCHYPPEFKNMLLIDFIKSQTLERLVCNLTIADRCPPQCRCFYQPGRSRTVVDCFGTGRRKLPSALPLKTDLEVDFSSKEISSLLNDTGSGNMIYSYSKYISKLDLSNNTIKIIPNDLVFKLRNMNLINVSKNKITKIPRTLQTLNPCQIYLGEVVILCKCKDIWLQNWLPSFHSKCFDNTRVYCKYNNEKVHILNMSKHGLGCRLYNEDILWLNISLAVTAFIVTVSSVLIYIFRFEIFITVRKILKYFKKIVVSSNLYAYDVYISCNEDDATLRHWLTSSFVPLLEDENLRVFLPFRDCE